MRIRYCFCTVILAVASVREALPAVFLSDGFSYPDGALQIVSSETWTGHSGATNQVDVSFGAVNLTGAESQDVNTPLVASWTNQLGASSALYAAFKLRVTALPTAAGSYFAHFKDEANGFRGRIWIVPSTTNPPSFRLGISSGSGTKPDATLEEELHLQTQYLIVTRMTLTNAVSALWINPESESDPNAVSASGTAISVNAFALRQAAGIGEMSLDDLVVASSFVEALSGLPIPSENPARIDPPVARISTENPISITVRWQANADVGYSIWRSDAPTGPFDLLTNGLHFSGPAAVFVNPLPPQDHARFYRISSP